MKAMILMDNDTFVGLGGDFTIVLAFSRSTTLNFKTLLFLMAAHLHLFGWSEKEIGKKLKEGIQREKMNFRLFSRKKMEKEGSYKSM